MPAGVALSETIVCLSVLQEEAQAHFGCPTLSGVELENQGGSGTMLSHWEKRILGVGLLTPSAWQQFPLPLVSYWRGQ